VTLKSVSIVSTMCIRGFVHHIFGEENLTHRWTKFGTSSSKSKPAMYDTNEHVHVCVSGSKLDQHKVFMTEFHVGESCYIIWAEFLLKPGIPASVLVAVTVQLRRTPRYTYLGLE